MGTYRRSQRLPIHQEDNVSQSPPRRVPSISPKKKQLRRKRITRALGLVSMVGIFLGLLGFVLSWGNSGAMKPSISFSVNEGPLELVNLSHLQVPTDYDLFTVRINTWKREDTLKVSIDHLSSCRGVAQIQVIWCVDQGNPPEWLVSLTQVNDLVVIEEHLENSLNERFRVQTTTPTKGILSIDDDILRPCVAYHAAFYKWTRNPDRIVGFDARSHEIAQPPHQQQASLPTWKYAYMSTTEQENRYSLTLTRCCFVHVDYLSFYTDSKFLAPIRQYVKNTRNCEDIGMSLVVSSQTSGLPPLLADFWVVKSMVKLESEGASGGAKISSGKDHKRKRDECVDKFSNHLGLKLSLQSARLSHGTYFSYGEEAHNWNARPRDTPSYITEALELAERWSKNATLIPPELSELRLDAALPAFEAGLVDGQHKEREKV